MKAQFLKIAKCKDEKSFYKKYPTQEAFFKAHPEAKSSIKKAQIGMTIAGGVPANTNKYVDYQNVYNDVYQQYTGIDIEEEQKLQREAQVNAQAIKEASKKEGDGGAGGGIMSMLKGLFGGEEGGEGGEGFGEDIIPTGTDIMAGGDLSMAARYGRNIPKAQFGYSQGIPSEIGYTPNAQQYAANQFNTSTPTPQNSFNPQPLQYGNGPISNGIFDRGDVPPTSGGGFSGFMDKAEGVAGKALPIIGPIISGIDALKQKKEVAKAAKQAKEVSELGLIASGTRPERIENKYNEPFDFRVGRDQLSKSYGVGTNVLTRNGGRIRQAANGTEIQNTYAPGTLYDDLGYEPLNDHYKLKQYYGGGYIPRAEGGGGFSGFMNEGGGAGVASGLNNSLFDNSGESQIGSGIGQGLGMLIPGVGGPIGSAVGGMLGGIYGKLFPTPDGKRDVEKTQRNIQGMAMNNMASQVRSPYTAYTKNGGNVNPQLINRFNELDAQDFAEFAHQDEFRAGGHLRNYRNPSEGAMQTYKNGGDVSTSALNGEVQTTWGGGVRTLSHNPHMPGTGETIEFVGNSHDTYDPRSKQTGIGVKYGQGNKDSYTDYAEYGTEQADANVEVEKEPAAELIDPKTGKKNLTVYGNLKIPKQFVSLLGDDKAKGMKFKHYVSGLSKQEERQNKIIATSTNLLNDLDVKNSFDKLKLSSLEASINGANMKLKTLADRKIKAADIQNAINETAEEYGIVADDLARGKYKIDKEAMQESARYGKQMFKGGGTIDALEKLKEMLKNKGFDYKETSDVRSGAKTKQGRKSRHSTGEAIDLTFPNLGKDSYNAMLNDPEIARFMLNNNITVIDEYDEDILKQTGGTGGHLHIGLDKGTKISDKFRNEAKALHGLKPTNAESIAEDNASIAAPATTTKETTKYNSIEEAKKDGYTNYNSNTGKWEKIITKTDGTKTKKSAAVALDEIPKGQKENKETGLYGGVTPEQFEAYKEKNKWFDWTRFDVKNKSHLNEYKEAFNEKAKSIGSTSRIKDDPDGIPKFGQQYISAIIDDQEKEKTSTTTTKSEAEIEDPQYEVVDYKRSKLADLFNQILPFIRPSDQESLDYAQLYPEMFALSNNSLEPVQAQGYQPDLKTPIDISYQDMLNANQADFNSTKRMVGYNPAVQGLLDAQKYSANEKVLGEQFRQNQQERNKVFSENIDTLNKSNLYNLDIYDRQYGRQAEARSNTKATTQAALNSISDKIARNKLENKTLGIYENLYNYRYDNKGRAINMNPLFQPNMPYIYGPDGKPTHRIVRDSKGNTIDLVPVTTKQTKATTTPSISSGPIVQQNAPSITNNTNVNDEYLPYDQEEGKDDMISKYKKNGGKVKNKYAQSSIVRGFK